MSRTPQEIAVEMLSTGLTQHQLSLLVELLACLSRGVTHNERYEIKREQGRLRAQNYRDRKRNGAGMAAHAENVTQGERDVTRDERDADTLILASLPLNGTKEVKRTSEEVSKEERKKERANKRKPAVPLPDDWQPNEKHYAAAKKLGRPEGFVESKAEDLRIWAESNDARKQNWDAVFHGFIRRDNSRGSTHGQIGNVIASQDKLIGKLAELNRPAPNIGGTGAIRSGESASPVRLLSKG